MNMPRKKNNPDGIYESIAVIRNDIKWIKEEIGCIKDKIDKINNRFWGLVLALLGILCTILAAVIKF